MPAAAAISVGDVSRSMSLGLHNANILARAIVCKTGNDSPFTVAQYANMSTDESERPVNYIRAWREYRGYSQEHVASLMGERTTKGTISQYETGARDLTTAKLRRLAVILECEAGDLIDHHPHDVPPDIRDLRLRASKEQWGQVLAVAETLVGYSAK
jgi:transcriptional regulator with XRE-family HTH domain